MTSPVTPNMAAREATVGLSVISRKTARGISISAANSVA